MNFLQDIGNAISQFNQGLHKVSSVVRSIEHPYQEPVTSVIVDPNKRPINGSVNYGGYALPGKNFIALTPNVNANPVLKNQVINHEMDHLKFGNMGQNNFAQDLQNYWPQQYTSVMNNLKSDPIYKNANIPSELYAYTGADVRNARNNLPQMLYYNYVNPKPGLKFPESLTHLPAEISKYY